MTGSRATWCGMAAPGYPPAPGEVWYANYLLTGETAGGGLLAAVDPVQRWTLDDP
jgi:hypothetical protein